MLTTTDNPFTQSSNTITASPTATSSPKSNDNNNGAATVIGSNGNELATYRKAHGIVMSVAVVLLFPLGAVFIRLGGSMWGHVAVQMSALISLAAGFGLGIKLGGITDLVSYSCDFLSSKGSSVDFPFKSLSRRSRKIPRKTPSI